MKMMDKKEQMFEEMSSIVGGNAVGPVKETGPLGYVDYPYKHETGPLQGPGPLNYPY